MAKNKQTGFALVFVILSVAAWLLIGFGTWRVVASNHSNTNKSESKNATHKKQAIKSSSLNSSPASAAKPTATSPASTPATKTTGTKTSASTSTSGTTTTSSGSTSSTQSVSKAYTVTYLSSGFTPNTLTIKAGDTVTFKNSSSKDVWPASDPHPTHSDYPAFDPGKAIPPGGEWSFTFTKVGTWGYHNHLQPGQTGAIIVQ